MLFGLCVWIAIIISGDMVAHNNSHLYDEKLTYVISHHTNGRPSHIGPHYMGVVSQNPLPIGKAIT
jgi:hypothetical protein